MAAVMTPDKQRKALVAVLRSVRGVSRVHDYQRIVRTEDEIRTRLADEQGRVNAWMIAPAASTTMVTERGPGHAGKGVAGAGNNLTTFQWQIVGYHYIDDAAATEKTFTDLVFSVMQTINSYGLLAIDGIAHQLPCDVETLGFVNLANLMLCHFARLNVGFTGRI